MPSRSYCSPVRRGPGSRGTAPYSIPLRYSCRRCPALSPSQPSKRCRACLQTSSGTARRTRVQVRFGDFSRFFQGLRCFRMQFFILLGGSSFRCLNVRPLQCHDAPTGHVPSVRNTDKPAVEACRARYPEWQFPCSRCGSSRGWSSEHRNGIRGGVR